MTDAERRSAADKFVADWKNRVPFCSISVRVAGIYPSIYFVVVVPSLFTTSTRFSNSMVSVGCSAP